MKLLNSKTHGIVDYFFVLFLWASPILFHLPEKTALFIYVLGTIHLLLTVATNFKFGIIKLIPFQFHGWIELIVSIALVGIAFYFESLEGILARNFCLAVAVLVFATWLVTEYSEVKEK